MPSIFDPIRLGSVNAANRLLMAPMTRGRATAGTAEPLPSSSWYRGGDAGYNDYRAYGS